jgi:nitroreductase
MDVIEALTNRKSCRGFLPSPVDKTDITKILDAARWAPSGVNHQPAKVAILGSETRAILSTRLIEAFRSGVKPNPDYEPPSKNWPDVYKQRRKACGLALYQALSISLEDHAARNHHWERNYTFFGAPAAMIVYVDKNMPKSSWIDMGIFIQSVLLAAEDLGLATCPQAAFSDYPAIVREVLALTDVDIICGIAIGYEDKAHPLNSYRTERDAVESFTCWYP